MDKREVAIYVVSNSGDEYNVTVVIDNKFDAEEQIDMFVDNNLINVQDWGWAY